MVRRAREDVVGLGNSEEWVRVYFERGKRYEMGRHVEYTIACVRYLLLFYKRKRKIYHRSFPTLPLDTLTIYLCSVPACYIPIIVVSSVLLPVNIVKVYFNPKLPRSPSPNLLIASSICSALAAANVLRKKSSEPKSASARNQLPRLVSTPCSIPAWKISSSSSRRVLCEA